MWEELGPLLGKTTEAEATDSKADVSESEANVSKIEVTVLLDVQQSVGRQNRAARVQGF